MTFLGGATFVSTYFRVASLKFGLMAEFINQNNSCVYIFSYTR